MPERRGTAAQRGYGYRWQQASKGFLRNHPVCVYCERLGKVRAATLVDHITPHKGDMALFWDRTNWQSLCLDCHNSVKAREERSGVVVGCDVHGMPLDPAHHWREAPVGVRQKAGTSGS